MRKQVQGDQAAHSDGKNLAQMLQRREHSLSSDGLPASISEKRSGHLRTGWARGKGSSGRAGQDPSEEADPS